MEDSKGAIKVPVPDTSQETDTTCGASALLAVCLYYQVGPKKEKLVAKAMHMDMKNGSDPEDILRAAMFIGLHHESVQPMTIDRLKQFLDQGIPVLIMLQAWSDPLVDYVNDWDDGHWVVAIGHDKNGIYFEDPSIARRRGFLTYHELNLRWQDVGKDNQPVPQHGLALWKPGVMPFSQKISKAEHID